ncbi:MAG: aminopeptidase [Pseudomonadota bacterium]
MQVIVANRKKAIVLLCGFLIVGCETVAWYGQAVSGQLSLLSKRQNIDRLLQQSDLDNDLRAQLRTVKNLTAFAEQHLHLPVGKTFTSYVDLQRPAKQNHVVWNVFAAPEFSVEPHYWCYPIAGCAQYRGYFSAEAAQNYAEILRSNSLDAAVGGVAAYSTLGWFADPILSTFVHYPEQRLAALVFHELAHKILYIADDTEFNESFATSVEVWGLKQWLRSLGREHELGRIEKHQQARSKFLAIIAQLRQDLESAYSDKNLDDDQRRTRKEQLFSQYRAKANSLSDPYFARWLESIDSNASLIPIQSYTRWTKGFTALLNQHSGDMPAFYEAVKTLSTMSPEQRHTELQYLTETAGEAVQE